MIQRLRCQTLTLKTWVRLPVRPLRILARAVARGGEAEVGELAAGDERVLLARERVDEEGDRAEDVEAVARALGLDPADVDVDALKAAASTTYSLDDDNFTEPTFNEKVKDYGMADPDVYEPLAADPWCGDDSPPDASS